MFETGFGKVERLGDFHRESLRRRQSDIERTKEVNLRLGCNNNVDVEYFDGRLFVAWRTGPTHFASEDTEMLVVSSADNGVTWDFETKVVLGADVRGACRR